MTTTNPTVVDFYGNPVRYWTASNRIMRQGDRVFDMKTSREGTLTASCGIGMTPTFMIQRKDETVGGAGDSRASLRGSGR